MLTAATVQDPMPSADVLLFLNLKPGVRLLTEHQCAVEREEGPDNERRAIRCTRPIWGDGRVRLGSGNLDFGMCSFHWHEWNAFHGDYVTMQANPAAAKVDNMGLARLFITRGLDAPPLPPPDDHMLYRELDGCCGGADTTDCKRGDAPGCGCGP